MRNVILYCPHLNRDIRGILAQVPNPMIETGYQTPLGHDGCLECHKSIVRKAQAENAHAVTAIEDDCEFTVHFNYDRWIEDAAWARNNGYDVLVGGSTRTYDEKIVREGMIEVSAFHSAHFVTYFQSGYAKILKAVQPFDYSLGANCGCRVVVKWPFVAVQRASFSGILQQNVDYVPLYQAHEQALKIFLHL